MDLLTFRAWRAIEHGRLQRPFSSDRRRLVVEKAFLGRSVDGNKLRRRCSIGAGSSTRIAMASRRPTLWRRSCHSLSTTAWWIESCSAQLDAPRSFFPPPPAFPLPPPPSQNMCIAQLVVMQAYARLALGLDQERVCDANPDQNKFAPFSPVIE